MHTWCSQRPEEGVISSGTGVTGGYDPPCEHWELKHSLLQEQQVLLTAEPSFQLLHISDTTVVSRAQKCSDLFKTHVDYTANTRLESKCDLKAHVPNSDEDYPSRCFKHKNPDLACKTSG